MADSRYQRVSRKRPCLICGKPDWCSRTPDDSISFCARVTTGADRLSRKEQWGVFYHDREILAKPWVNKSEPRNFYKRERPEIIAAPLEIRDFVYSSLLRLSPAKNYQSITHGVNGLLERGLDNLEDYGGLPCSTDERKDLAAQIRLLLNQNFPAFVRQNPHSIQHVPGFWIDEAGDANLWQARNFQNPLLLIPYRDPFGKIQACQLRFTGPLAANKKRYLWLSLPNNASASSGTPLHFAGWQVFGRDDNSSKPVLVTEGALKADVVSKLCPDFFTIANGGVNCSHDLILGISRGKILYLAFDNDYHENPVVARQIARLLKMRLDDNGNEKAFSATKIFVWDQTFKGIDDALLKGKKLIEIPIAQWFSSLDEKCRHELQKDWSE